MSDVIPNTGVDLTAEERSFVRRYQTNGRNRSEAYRFAFPEKASRLVGREMGSTARDLFNKTQVQGYLAFLDMSARDKATRIFNEGMESGEPGRAQKAAEKVFDKQLTDQTREATDLWAERLCEIGARIVKPVPPGGGEVVVSMEDLISGKAFAVLTAEAKVQLAEMAGAPWNDQHPDASLSDLQKELLGREERVIIVHGGSGVGKALALDTPIPTPNGWSAMGDLRVGDRVYDETGAECKVTGLTPVMHDRPCFEVVFDDGTSIVADENHEWLSHEYRYRKSLSRRLSGRASKRPGVSSCVPRMSPTIRTTREMSETIFDVHGGKNHAIPTCGPIQSDPKPLPIDPYLLGVWLGDGSSRSGVITTSDENKHVPERYLRASEAQRLSLLQGLMDSDGTINKTGRCSFDNTNRFLSEAVAELARSLGIKTSWYEKRATLYGKDCGACYRVGFTTTIPVFRLKRKLDRLPKSTRQTTGYRYVVEVRPAPSVPVRCIEVSSDSHLYLAGNGMVPTHNSVINAVFVLCELALPNRRVVIVGGTYDHCRTEFQYVYQGFVKLFGERSAKTLRNVFINGSYDMRIETLWGSSVEICSTSKEHGQWLLGKEFDLVALAEGSHVTPYVYQHRILRAVDRRAKTLSQGDWKYQRRTGRIFIPTTPKGYDGCAASEWERVMDASKKDPIQFQIPNKPWAESVYLREASAIENPSYDKSIFEARRRSLNKQAFDEQYLGKMVKRSGLIYAEYEPKIHDVEMPPFGLLSQMRFGVGMDTGKHFGAMLAGIDPDGNGYFLGEVYTGSADGGEIISENCNAVREMLVDVLAGPLGITEDRGPDAQWEMVRDRIELWYVDPASQHKEDIIEHLDVPLQFEKLYEGNLLSTIDTVRNAYKNESLFVVADNCPWYLWELGRYQWGFQPANKTGTSAKAALLPRKGDDHLLDASRFIFVPLLEMGPPEKRRQGVTFEDNWQRQQNYEVFGHLVDKLQNPGSASMADAYYKATE